MWTEIARPKYQRHGGRYASDLTDREWALVEPFMLARRKIGRPRTTALRDVVDAILYIASTGCPWAMLANDVPTPSTVQRYFYGPDKRKVRAIAFKGLAQPHRQMPRAFLRDLKITVQLHRGDALERRRHEINGDGPNLKTQI